MSNIENVLQEKSYPVTFTALDTLIRATGLEYILQGDQPVTLFAPYDKAFEDLPLNVFDLLRENSKLTELLKFHIVPLRLSVGEMREAWESSMQASGENRVEEMQLQTLSDHLLRVDFGVEDELRVEGVDVIELDVQADNGVIHVIDKVLWPPDLSVDDFLARAPGESTP
ncbi:putative surface protein with fasciclin (FAS1) repeats [Thermosporothrix hazakensis]|jgi:uncharacterized surface protein with fasciclin (FAS1) repeats|uniref:Beta-Ig-H3/fasciclin n=2 Tax=Thermosporothrix TaxID=768650 RepID=A0A455SWD2_9CHLR|nr:fasciclin domain-containing protein [Thermosporothrix hazakensis]PZW30508.1 putative surface protein with fasciclin (FAS1) repeats [Thermosporothrix hazakensis]BBH91222.1 beta-Ig-H3/fasciclin [Thermosporothrix sp. COM3]GCE49368.1 beta-Ig-H3/fasciclin [Thermosporothrix hazakensis]